MENTTEAAKSCYKTISSINPRKVLIFKVSKLVSGLFFTVMLSIFAKLCMNLDIYI
jgi:hypothetical protein